MIQSTATQMSKVLAVTAYEKLLTELELLSLEKGEDRPNSLPITSLFLVPASPILGLWGTMGGSLARTGGCLVGGEGPFLTQLHTGSQFSPLCIARITFSLIAMNSQA